MVSKLSSAPKQAGYYYTVIIQKDGKQFVHESNSAADICVQCLETYNFKQDLFKISKYKEKTWGPSHRVLVAETSKSYLLCEFFNNSACRIVVSDYFEERLSKKYSLRKEKKCHSSTAQDFLIKALAYGMKHYDLSSYNCNTYCREVYNYLK